MMLTSRNIVESLQIRKKKIKKKKINEIKITFWVLIIVGGKDSIGSISVCDTIEDAVEVKEVLTGCVTALKWTEEIEGGIECCKRNKDWYDWVEQEKELSNIEYIW